MAFDVTQPTNSTKIRNLGTVIRPNWLAIEEAGPTFLPHAINLTDRTAAGLAVNPTAVVGFVPYCKQDAQGNAEFYGIDAASNVIQLSEQGTVGGRATNFTLNNFRVYNTALATYTTYTRNNVIHTYGTFTTAGTGTVLHNCTTGRSSAGVYVVTMTVPPTTTNYVVTNSIVFGGTYAPTATIEIVNASVFRIRTFNSNGNASDSGVQFHVCGGY